MDMIKLLNIKNRPVVDEDSLELHTIDVGQGNCLIVRFPHGGDMLVDAGTSSSEPGEDAIIEQINEIMGDDKFETIVITHPDEDHCCIIPKIPAAQEPDNVHISMRQKHYPEDVQEWFDGLPDETNIVVYSKDYCCEGETSDLFESGSADVYVMAANKKFNPDVDKRYSDKNTPSIVLRIEHGDVSVTLTGDATKTTERFILQNWPDYDEMETTALCFGHHGSNHSSSKTFIDGTSPKIGLFSASSSHMGYGHPRFSVCAMIKDYLCQNGSVYNIIQHRLKLYVGTPGRDGEYKFFHTLRGIFLTATQGNILFKSDTADYEVHADQTGM